MISISFGNMIAPKQAAVAFKHLMLLDGAASGTVVNAPTDDFARAPLPDVVAMLNAAAAQKIIFSRQEMATLGREGADDLKKANSNDYAERGGGIAGAPAASSFAHVWRLTFGKTDPRLELAYQRACALPYNEAHYMNLCADLGKYYEDRGDRRMALAVYLNAPKCANEAHPDPHVVPPCHFAAARLFDAAGEPNEATQLYATMCSTYATGCEEYNRRGGHADLAAAQAQRQANIAQQDADREQEVEDRKARAQASDARFAAVMGALQSMPGANDPNAIVNSVGGGEVVAVQQVQAAANAARASRPLQPVSLVQPAAPATRSAAASTPAIIGISTPAGTATSTEASSATAGQSEPVYLTPLASSCVRQYWDPQSYNWLSFENDCGQPIHLTFIFNQNVGWAMTGAMDLSPGARQTTGRSSNDINQARGYDFYVCPSGSIPVDLAGNPLTANVSEFRCKP